jgi:ribonuclease P protein component
VFDQRFPRQLRLTKPAEFTAVFNQGKRGGDRQINILSRPNAMSHGRLGLVIAKKYLRKAVDRNRVKRQIRESFRHSKQHLHGMDVVVLLRADIRTVSNSQLRTQLLQAWEQVAKRCDK